MFIHEAIAEAEKDRKDPRKHIQRKKWKSPSVFGTHKICPTDTPDGCLYYSPASKMWTGGWQPTKEDLIADDWELASVFDR